MKTNRAAHIVWIAALVSSLAQAGGSATPVTIESLKITGTTYTLVVVAVHSGEDDAYLGTCTRFTVHGLYWFLNGAFLKQPEMLSREGHLAALGYLQDSFANRRVVNFGGFGSGFAPIDASKPCIVLSRALFLWDDEKGRSVFSFHNAI